MTVMGKLRGIAARNPFVPDKVLPDVGVYRFIREALVLLFFALLVFHVYAHSKDGPFVFDDLPNIAGNPSIHITSLDWQSLRKAAFESPIPTRPVVNISFAINYYADRLNPKSFRLVNVLIHLANGFLLLLFLKATLKTPALKGCDDSRKLFMPFAAATIWIVNPVHTQSVSYIVQRMNSMCAMFCLLAFLLYIHARLSDNPTREKWLWGGAISAFLLALGSKENSITLPFFVFLYEWYFFRDLDLKWLKKNSWWLLVISVFSMGVAFFYVESTPLVEKLSVYQALDLSLIQRTLTQFRVVIFYIFLFLFPHPSRLNLDHHFPISQSLLDPPTTLLSIFAVCTILLTVVIIARRQRFLSFAVLWFMGNLVVEASVPGLDMVFEHRTYLPSILISMVIVMFLYQFIGNVWVRRAVLCFFVVLGVLWTHDRNLIWADKTSLWEDAARKSPEKSRPNINAGVAFSEIGQFEKGIKYLQEAVRLKPDYANPRLNLANSLFASGEFVEAERHARAILPMQPIDEGSLALLVMAHNTVAKSLVMQGKRDEATEYFYKALDLNPDDAVTNFNLSLVLSEFGDFEEAAKHCSEALRIKPDYASARIHLQEIRRRMKFQRRSLPENVFADENF